MSTPSLSLSDNLLAATEALAENLLHSEPLTVYHQAQARLEADTPAQQLLERLATTQADLRTRQPQGMVTSADVESLRAVQLEVQSNPTIMDYAQTQQTAVLYLREINQEISQLLGMDFSAWAKRSGCC